MQIPNLYHYSDPNAKNYHPWHFVYAHGEAEIYNGQQMQHLEDRSADDLLCSDQPMPTQEGEYKAKLYGKDVIVVIAKNHFLKGRAALTTDIVALEHCRKPEDWR